MDDVPVTAPSAPAPQPKVAKEITHMPAPVQASSSTTAPHSPPKPAALQMEAIGPGASLDPEAERRKKRAERFGVEVVTPASTEATTSKAIGKAAAKSPKPAKAEKPLATPEDVS